MRGQKTALTGRSPLRRRRFALVCSAIEEEEEEEEEEEDGYDDDFKAFSVYDGSMGE